MLKVTSALHKYGGVGLVTKVADKPREPFKVNTDVNGMTVVSVTPKFRAMSRVAAVFNAGSRYETHESKGMNHLLRRSVGLSSGGFSAINVTRHFQQMSANLRCVGTRESLSYVVDFSDNIKDNVLELLAVATTRQTFYAWELEESSKKLMEFDIQYLNRRDFDMLSSELLHKAAYRDTVGNSLFANPYKLGHWNIDVIENFLNHTFTANNSMLIGISIRHESLMKHAENFKIRPRISPVVNKAIFRGGEFREDLPIGLCKVSLVWEAPGLNNIQDAFATSILANAIDNGINMNIKWNSGELELLRRLVKDNKVTDNCVANSVYTCYSDTGMLGFTVDGDPSVIGESVTAIYKHFKEVGNNGIAQKDFDTAKQQLKMKLLKQSTSLDGLVESLIAQSSLEGVLLSIDDMLKLVDNVTINDVNKVAKSILSHSKLAMSGVGELYNVPYLSDLQS